MGYLHRSYRRGASTGARNDAGGRQVIARSVPDATGRRASGVRPHHKSKAGPDVELWDRGRILALRPPFATTVWDYINRAMPLNREGTLRPTGCPR